MGNYIRTGLVILSLLFAGGCIVKVYVGKTDIRLLSAEATDNQASMFDKEVKNE